MSGLPLLSSSEKTLKHKQRNVGFKKSFNTNSFIYEKKHINYFNNQQTYNNKDISNKETLRRYKYCCLIICCCIIISFLMPLFMFPKIPDLKIHITTEPKCPVMNATHKTISSRIGFVLLGLGPYARQLKCEAAIESLRTHGGWDGDIFLITDAHKCYETNLWTDCNLNAKIIDVDENLSNGFAFPSAKKTKGNRLKSKMYKPQIFEIITDVDIDILIYMDCDILVSEKNNELHEFINEYSKKFDEKNRIFFFPAKIEGALNGVIHSGVMIAHRIWSKPVMDKWLTQLKTGIDHSDQAAFIRAGNTEFGFIDEKYFLKPSCEYHECEIMQTKLFTHVNNGKCMKLGANNIQVLVDRWKLCVYKNTQYCYPLYMAPFAMTWLPYTSCKKLEKGLKI